MAPDSSISSAPVEVAGRLLGRSGHHSRAAVRTVDEILALLGSPRATAPRSAPAIDPAATDVRPA
jgi:hypothetical protein